MQQRKNKIIGGETLASTQRLPYFIPTVSCWTWTVIVFAGVTMARNEQLTCHHEGDCRDAIFTALLMAPIFSFRKSPSFERPSFL